MLEGMGRIVQILFTGIPVITFLGSVMRYAWKFLSFLGSSAAQALPSPAQAAEDIWSHQSLPWNHVKLAVLFAAGLISLRIIMRRRHIQAQELWESSSSSDEEVENEAEAAPAGLMSEEDRGVQPPPLQPPPLQQGYQQYGGQFQDLEQQDYWNEF
jgi:hypothetical protein